MEKRLRSAGRPTPTSCRGAAVLCIGLLLGLVACGEPADRPAAREPEGAAERPAAKKAAPRSGPNLVLITLDTTRADALGVYGQRRETTPAIDEMALSGVLLENAVASSPLTLPSHSTILSGKHPYAHGVRSNSGYVLSDENVMLAEVLRDRGYETAAEVAVDVLERDSRIDQGFEHFRGPDDSGVDLKQVVPKNGAEKITKPIRPGADISRKGIEFLRAQRHRKFFLWLHYFDAHHPHTPPPAVAARFPDSRYHAAVADQDFSVGRVLDEIERLGIRGNTLVILTADHGEGLGEHGEETHAYFVYDTTMRVPLIFWGLKGLREGAYLKSLVRTVDIAPTALDLLGLPPLVGIQGVSLAPLLTGRVSDVSLLGYGESLEIASTFGLPPLRFVREGRWKYIHKVDPELYDVAEDPAERNDLAGEKPEIVSRLQGKLEELLRAAPAKPGDSATSVDARTAAELAALGYVSNAPMAADYDELESLQLFGEDPAGKAAEIRAITVAMASLQVGRHQEALAAVGPLAEKHPDSAYLSQLRGDALTGLGRTEQAIASYQRVLEVNPCDERSLSQLNNLLRSERRFEELVVVLRKGVEACSNQTPLVLNNYAWALATIPRDDLRDGATAVRVAQEALAMLPAPDPGYRDTLAAALAEGGRFEEAVQVQAEVVSDLRKAGVSPQTIAGVERRLEAYRAGVGVRDPEPPGS